MPTPLTKIEVYNMALDHISSPAIATLATEDAPTRLLNRNWNIIVLALLESYPWDFAKERHELTAEVTDPTFKWTKRYQIPPGTVRVLPITYNGERDGDLIPHEIVGNYIETDHASPMRITTIRNLVDNPGEWSALFTHMVALSLGLILSKKFTNKRAYTGDIDVALARATARAEAMDTLGSTPDPIEQHDIIRVRGGDEYYGRRWRRP